MAVAKPATNASGRDGRRRTSGYVSQSGATTSVANFVHDDSATKMPRAQAELASQNPQIRKAAGIESFVFELATYWVNGYAAQANMSTDASKAPPNRKPTRPRPMRQTMSTATAVIRAAGRLSHLPDQPAIQYAGRYDS